MANETKIIWLFLDESCKITLEKAVCNHGFFMMAPNRWDPTEKSLSRPLRLLSNNESVDVSITQFSRCLQISLLNPTTIISIEDSKFIEDQVSRMLRISAIDQQRVDEFHSIHPVAKKNGFGRIFRSPSIFEDIVKSFLLCNCTWARSLSMAQALCDLQKTLGNTAAKKEGYSVERKRRKMSVQAAGNFPTAKELAYLDEEMLRTKCNLGYRARLILDLSVQVTDGRINLEDVERSGSTDLLRNILMGIKGVGPFTVANVMMCVGFYQHIPSDSETIKHLKEVHLKTNLDNKNIEPTIAEIYDKYTPYQCLTYWFERVQYYEKKFGKLSELPDSKYANVTSTNIKA